MSPKGTKGKRSVWQAVDRCLDIVVRLMQGPARSEELLEIVEDYVRDDGGISDLKGVFEEDRSRIRKLLCEMSHDRSGDEYTLGEFRRPLFNLSDEAVRGLAFIQKTFSSPHTPMREEVQALIENVMRVLPSHRRRNVQNERGLLEIELKTRDRDVISEDIRDAVEKACIGSQLVQILYQANRADKEIVLHRIEPLRYFFDPIYCHHYLEGFCLNTHSTAGRYDQNKVWWYRLGRIVEIVPLPTHFVRGRRRIPSYELVYKLTPEVARYGVTEHFPNSHITHYEDGSAEVRAFSTNLFFDVRKLLHYGPHCHLIGGEEAVKDMKTLIQEMYKGYFPAAD